MTGGDELADRNWWRPAPAVAVRSEQVASAKSRRSALAFWALMYFLFSLLIAPQTIVPGLDALHLAAVSVVVAVIAHVVSSLRSRQSIFGSHPAMLFGAGLAGWALLTTPFSRWRGGSVELLFDLYFKSLIIFWLLAVIVDTKTRLKQMATWLTLLTLPISATGVKNFFAGVYIGGGNTSAPRIAGYDAPLTANPNDLALVLCMMLPLAVALAAGETRPLRRIVFAACAALDVAATVLTFSRTGFLTLGALAIFTLFRLPRRQAAMWTVGVVTLALMALPLLPAGYLHHMGTITAVDSDPTGSAQDRSRDSLIALSLIAANPIVGVGPGMSVLALNEIRGPTWAPVHNVYLQYATDLGLPGLILFLLMLGACLRMVTRVVRETARNGAARDFRCIAVGVQMMLMAFVVSGFFHPVAYHFHFYYAGGLAAALAVVWENERGSITSDSGVRQRPGDRWHRTPVRESRAGARPGGVPGARGDAFSHG